MDKDVRKGLGWLFALFFSFIVVLYLLFSYIHLHLSEDEKAKFTTIPTHLEQAIEIAHTLKHHSDLHFFSTALTFSLLYLFLQSFSIPGTSMLNGIAPLLFPSSSLFFTLLLCSFNAAIGASIAYGVSMIIGKKVLIKIIPTAKLNSFAQKVEANSHHLFFYLLFLRITPLLPNWFINWSCPLFPIPLFTFFLATFFGVMPQTLITMEASLTIQHAISSHLHKLSGEEDQQRGYWVNFIILLLLGVASLLPTLPCFQRLIFSSISSTKPEREKNE